MAPNYKKSGLEALKKSVVLAKLIRKGEKRNIVSGIARFI